MSKLFDSCRAVIATICLSAVSALAAPAIGSPGAGQAELAKQILADQTLSDVHQMAKDLLKRGFNAGSGYGEAWIRDLNTFIEVSIEVGTSAGKRWRPVIAVSQHPTTGRSQLDVDELLQTRWQGLYRDEAIYHMATPAMYQIEGKWYLYAQACPLPENANYIDGHWDLWCFTCGRQTPTLPGCESICVPGR